LKIISFLEINFKAQNFINYLLLFFKYSIDILIYNITDNIILMINQQERGLDLSSIYRIDMDKRSKNKEKYNITEYNLPEYVILDDDNDSDKDDQDPSTDSK